MDERLQANLQRLVALRDAGSLTQEQFDVARRVLLDRALAQPPEVLQLQGPPPRPELPPEVPPGDVWWVPHGWREWLSGGLAALGFVVFAFIVANHLTSRVVDADRVDLAAASNIVPPPGYTAVADESGGLSPEDLKEFGGAPEEVEASQIYERGYGRRWQRADGSFAALLVIEHPDRAIADSFIDQTDAPGFRRVEIATVSDSVFGTIDGAGIALGGAKRGAMSAVVVAASPAPNDPVADARPFLHAADAALQRMPSQLCVVEGACRARTLPIALLFSMPVGGMALLFEGARRRRLGIGFPIYVEGLRGIISRATVRQGLRSRRADVVAYEDALVLARPPFVGIEPIAGLFVAGFIGVWAGYRAAARRDAKRRNELSVTHRRQVEAAHASNRVIPYDDIREVRVLATRRSGRAKVTLVSGETLTISWWATFNTRIRAEEVLEEALGPKVTTKRRRVSPVEVTLIVLVGSMVLLALVGLMSTA